ncbi:hypothetical protein I7I50_06283 [Histoplasma capsulatum G186AR]|uniref:Uncharacterized protein n=1 Tax=Ajellomyces capsulatus TaxID=5037 RepID=A0A8H8D429_AJECA|nr:hypothetical protein I7I52_10644 [Histoplasma capsulatum]QSS67264.1 hypothetical protein I7I50_06283 [Histoplasma capsulatum G186AR]
MIIKHRSPSTPRPLDTHPPVQNIMWRHHPIPERNLQRQHPLSARTHRPMPARNHIWRINSDEESVRPAFHQKPVEAGWGVMMRAWPVKKSTHPSWLPSGVLTTIL